ncbi:MAG: helix-turn-helix transcriptional regulator [Candidatus Omnitrophica bacterium]|nr:helix-turn-helix transcriptional regulator [Candidatus Omnitrophota bacterium]
MHLGNRIRDLRKEKKITLVELSQMTGVAQATLSRIETGVMKGTVDSHLEIAKALGMTLADLYAGLDERGEKIAHQEAGGRLPVSLRTNKVRCELLTQEAMKKKITPLLFTLDPKSETESEKLPWGTEKFFWVVEGEITVKLDRKEVVLKEDETLYFEASLPHLIQNRGPKKARLFCAVSPTAI